MGIFDKLFGRKKPFEKKIGNNEKRASEEQHSQPALTRKVIVLSSDAKTKISELIQKATACWAGDPSGTSTWLCRTAMVLAEAGDQPKAVEALERARDLLLDEQDSDSADTVAVSSAKAGSTLNDAQLFERGLGLVNEIPETGS